MTARSIPVDRTLEHEIEAFRRARVARMKAGAELFAGAALPPPNAEAVYRTLRDAELDAALDLACAVESRAEPKP